MFTARQLSEDSKTRLRKYTYREMACSCGLDERERGHTTARNGSLGFGIASHTSGNVDGYYKLQKTSEYDGTNQFPEFQDNISYVYGSRLNDYIAYLR